MTKRPLSVTIIAWWLIVAGAANAFVVLLLVSGGMDDPTIRELMARTRLPVAFQLLMQALGAGTFSACGIGMLRGHAWSRVLYVGWSCTSFVVLLTTSPMPLVLVPSLALFVVIAILLYRPNATRFFAAKSVPTSAPNAAPKLRSLVGIIVLIVAGFAVFNSTLMCFVRPEPTKGVLEAIAFWSVAALALIGLGASIVRAERRLVAIGVALLCGSGLTGLVILLLALTSMPSRASDLFPTSTAATFTSNVPAGSAVTAGIALLGLLLTTSPRAALDPARDEPA